MLLSDKEVVFKSKLLEKITMLSSALINIPSMHRSMATMEEKAGGGGSAIKMNDYLPFHRRKEALIEGRVGTFFHLVWTVSISRMPSQPFILHVCLICRWCACGAYF